MSEYRPALLILKKRRHDTKHFYFESHLDAFDTAKEYSALGWGWEMIRVEYIPAGQKKTPEAMDK